MCIETPGRYRVSQMQTILKCRQTWFQSEMRKCTHRGHRFTEYSFLNSAIALSSILESYSAYLSFLHKKTVFVSVTLCLPTFQEKMPPKKKKSPDIGHLSPPCPHLVSDLSPAPLLISRGIEVTLPLFLLCCRIAVAYGHSSSLQ